MILPDPLPRFKSFLAALSAAWGATSMSEGGVSLSG
jgi:hypothetical protein